MRKVTVIAGLTLVAILAALFQLGSEPPLPRTAVDAVPERGLLAPAAEVTNAIERAPSAAPTPMPAAPKPNSRLAGSPLAGGLNAANSDAARDVAALHGMLRQYFIFLKNRPGHPIGNDSDLARALTGHNPMKLVILPSSHPALSPDGRLRDRFGTPYFIHPRGGRAYEIRSAGPDRKLFTADDAIANPGTVRTDLSDVPDDPEFAEP